MIETSSYDSETLRRVRDLVIEHGWNATSYQIVNPGMEHWFAPDGNGVIGYVRRSGLRIVAGAPVAPFEALASVAAAFEDDAGRHRESVCYFGAERRVEELLGHLPTHSMVSLGAQPVWNPSGWEVIFERSASLRAQLNRARNKNITVTEWSSNRAEDNPKLYRCLAEWLAGRGLPPMGFLVEPDLLGRLHDRRIFVAERDSSVVVGYLIASPVPMRQGWLIEQIVRGAGAVNGTAELMLHTAMSRLALDGSRYATLGLAPLSHRASLHPDEAAPLWLRFSLGWVRAHGRRFYNFDGLDAFKAKFFPEQWEPVYAISNQPRFHLRTLYAIASAFTVRSPMLAIAGGLSRAVSTEYRRFARSI